MNPTSAWIRQKQCTCNKLCQNPPDSTKAYRGVIITIRISSHQYSNLFLPLQHCCLAQGLTCHDDVFWHPPHRYPYKEIMNIVQLVFCCYVWICYSRSPFSIGFDVHLYYIKPIFMVGHGIPSGYVYWLVST